MGWAMAAVDGHNDQHGSFWLVQDAPEEDDRALVGDDPVEGHEGRHAGSPLASTSPISPRSSHVSP
jgi:hypothetical protein